MINKFKGKYRIESARLAGWDYGWNASYFITICTAGRKHLFGEIYRDEMILSDMGEIVLQEWEKSFEMRAELFCDAFVIMPNHIHAILRIEKPEKMYDDNEDIDGKSSYGIARRSPRSVSSFVAGFKSAATKRINKFRGTPGLAVWQPRYHDHIIRNEKSFDRIKQYIINNPVETHGRVETHSCASPHLLRRRGSPLHFITRDKLLVPPGNNKKPHRM